MKIIIVLENIRSVYNVGSIFRTMEGFGILDVVLVGITPTPIDVRGNKRLDFKKTALGSEDRVRWEYFEHIDNVFTHYQEAHIVAIENGAGGMPLDIGIANIDQNQTYIFIFGSEVDGVSEAVLAHAHETWFIEMYGTKESFNVSVVAGIVLYSLSKISTQ